MALLDPKDGGLLSRKFLLTFYAISGFFALSFAASRWPMIGANLPVITGAVLGALGLYFGAGGYHSKLLKDLSGKPGDGDNDEENSPNPVQPVK